MKIMSAIGILLMSMILSSPVEAHTTKDLYSLYEIEIPGDIKKTELKLRALSQSYGLQELYKSDSDNEEEYYNLKIVLLEEEVINLQDELNEKSKTLREMQEKLQEEKSWLPSQQLFALIDEWRFMSESISLLENKLSVVSTELEDKLSFQYEKRIEEPSITHEQLEELRQLVKNSVSFTYVGDLKEVPYPVLAYPVIYPQDTLVQRASPGASVIALFEGKIHRTLPNEVWLSHGAEVYTAYKGIDKTVYEIGETILQNEKFALAGKKGFVEVELWIAGNRLNLERIKLNSIYKDIEIKG